MSHWNLSDHSIAFTRWHHIPSLLAQSLQLAMTWALQCVSCGYDVGKISAGWLVTTDVVVQCFFFKIVITFLQHS